MGTPIKMPRLSKGMETGTVLEWLKAPGEEVREGEPLFHVLTEKADVEVQAPGSGTLLQVAVPAGEEAGVGAVLGWVGEPGEVVGAAASGEVKEGPERPAGGKERSKAGSDERVKASPVARRLASEHGLRLAAIEGSGPQGMITKSDVEEAVRIREESALGVEAEDERQEQQDQVERIPLKGIRRVMAERMALSKRTAADVTTVVDVDMGAVQALREHVAVTYTSAVVKAASLGLRKHPILNATLDEEEIVLHKGIHVGVAVDSARGLTVLTIADADQKSLRQIDDELQGLVEAAKRGTLQLEEVETPTFTVTNSGVLGSLMFTPIINPPQSGILGMGKVQETPVVRDGEIVVGVVMYLCLTYDHRIVEGAEAVGFLQAVKGCLEDPVRMM